ncbi:FadR/GntR family transcriptional regulator [Paraburkholderia sp. BL10I2N1]|uniref:FCD domain-containing protein n=1 Tax=Paraburkholderia sp. BL10I2N1 TaxID=1938796 RepID=UPI001060963E
MSKMIRRTTTRSSASLAQSTSRSATTEPSRVVLPKSIAARSGRTAMRQARYIAEDIRAMIIRDSLSPGDRLPGEKDLMATYGSARATVREALAILESHGLVEVTPGKNGGVSLADIPTDTVLQGLQTYLYFRNLTWQHIYDARESIEPEIARSSCESLTPDVLQSLEHTVELCRAGLRGELDRRAHKNAEIDFHEIIARHCPNPLLRFVGLFLCRAEREMIEDLLTFDDEDSSLKVIREHEELIEMFRRGDVEHVHSLMHRHLLGMAESIESRREKRNGGAHHEPPVKRQKAKATR